MPLTPKDNLEHLSDVDVKRDGKTKFAISNWTSYTNQKASMANAGEGGHIFAGKCLPFKNEDITQMVGVYILDGLAPSHQIIQKMQPQSKERTHGNDFIASCIFLGYEQKYRAFRHFFGTQDPLMAPPPPQAQCPNFKVDEFFRWNRYI